jgi:hypothetical protein
MDPIDDELVIVLEGFFRVPIDECTLGGRVRFQL